MKLLTKTSLIYLLATTIVFVAGGAVFYYNLRGMFDEETEESLYIEKKQVEKYVEERHAVPDHSVTAGDVLSFTPSAEKVKEALTDSSLFSAAEGEVLPYRCLTFSVQIGGQNYTAVIRRPTIESDDLVEEILWSYAVIVVALLVVLFVVNRMVNGKLWKPFFSTLEKLRHYDLTKHGSLKTEPVKTKEFAELNAELEKMTQKIEGDYRNLKSFTENASHELQTPLAVILNTAEMLQQENLTEKQFREVERIRQTANRLSKTNQALLLLAKIENRQFEEKEEIVLAGMLKSKMEMYGQFAGHKGVTFETNLVSSPKIRMHPALADILLSNLLGNAIRHTEKDGAVKITLAEKELSVCNTGKPLQSAPEKLFERFYKENPSSESTGLGLALVKQIADTNGLKISYTYRQNMHCFVLEW